MNKTSTTRILAEPTTPEAQIVFTTEPDGCAPRGSGYKRKRTEHNHKAIELYESGEFRREESPVRKRLGSEEGLSKIEGYPPVVETDESRKQQVDVATTKKRQTGVKKSPRRHIKSLGIPVQLKDEKPNKKRTEPVKRKRLNSGSLKQETRKHSEALVKEGLMTPKNSDDSKINKRKATIVEVDDMELARYKEVEIDNSHNLPVVSVNLKRKQTHAHHDNSQHRAKKAKILTESKVVAATSLISGIYGLYSKAAELYKR